jgi:hypothetical protein
MPAKQMFPPREIENPFGDDCDEVKLGIGFRILAGQIVMMFSDRVEWIRMTSGGARKLAATLTEQAAELDRRRGDVPAPGVKPAHLPEGENPVMPPKRSSRTAGKSVKR